MSKTETEHIGTKTTIGMFFGMLLALIYAVLQFFSHPKLTLDELYNIALVTAFFVIVWTLLIFLGQILWKYAHGLSEKVG